MFSEFPAPAGINLQRLLGETATTGVPRASGDKPGRGRLLCLRLLSSPRQRG